VFRRVVDIWRYRELLTGLISKELAVKYNASFLGMFWSMLNPAFTLGIYYFVFQVVLGSGISDFAIFLMSGLLAFNLFNYSTQNATGTMVGNAGIVKKVAFPREILPLAPGLSYLPLIVPALLALIVLSATLAVFLSAVNVYLRDTQHLVELIVGAAWFWSTPIVYSYSSIAKKLAAHHIPSWVPLLNPLTDIVLVFQRAIYAKVYGASKNPGALRPGSVLQQSAQTLPVNGQWWYLWHVLVVLGVSVFLLFGALAVFGRLEGNFAEEL